MVLTALSTCPSFQAMILSWCFSGSLELQIDLDLAGQDLYFNTLHSIEIMPLWTLKGYYLII